MWLFVSGMLACSFNILSYMTIKHLSPVGSWAKTWKQELFFQVKAWKRWMCGLWLNYLLNLPGFVAVAHGWSFHGDEINGFWLKNGVITNHPRKESVCLINIKWCFDSWFIWWLTRLKVILLKYRDWRKCLTHLRGFGTAPRLRRWKDCLWSGKRSLK